MPRNARTSDDERAADDNSDPIQPKQESFEIDHLDKSIPCIRYNPSVNSPDLIFTHGAGGTLNAPAMLNFAAGFSETKPLLFFQGSMNVKARKKSFHAVIENQGWSTALGGRSMGARAAVMASHDDSNVNVLVLVSYPLTNSKGDVRDDILLKLREDIETLFIIGDRDSMCDLDELDEVRKKMKCKSWLLVIEGADHGMTMKPKKATDVAGRWTGQLAAQWLESRDLEHKESSIRWDDATETIVQSPWKKQRGENQTATQNADLQLNSNMLSHELATRGKSKPPRSGRKRVSKDLEKELPEESQDEEPLRTKRTRASRRKQNLEPSPT